jgi:hypothetical protein
VKSVLNVALAGVGLSLLTLAAAPANAVPPAVPPTDIQSFVKCLNSFNSTVVSDAVACVPSNCYATVTLSEESAQPGCTLKDGTRLPRVIFSCPGFGGSQTLRFRPSFSLCTRGDIINHVEVGEDVDRSNRSDDPELRGFPFVQKMGDIDSIVGFSALTEFGPANDPTAVVDTNVNSQGCAECHDRLGTVSTNGNVVNLFGPIPPALADGTIFTNDPAVAAPAIQTPLSVICAGIAASKQLGKNLSKQALAFSLCSKLEPKTH